MDTNRSSAVPDWWTILYEHGLALLGAGSSAAAATLLAEATGLALLTGQAGREAAAAAALGMAYRLAGDPLPALGHAQQALDAARRDGRPELAQLALTDLGAFYAPVNSRLAIPCYEAALALARRQGDAAAEVALLGDLGLACQGAGDTGRALQLHTRALALARAGGDWEAVDGAVSRLGLALLTAGCLVQARALLEEHLAAARAAADRAAEARTLFQLGIVQAEHAPEQAVVSWRQALLLAQALGQERNAALISYDLAVLLVRLGRIEDARPYARQALRHAGLAEQARGLLARMREQ